MRRHAGSSNDRVKERAQYKRAIPGSFLSPVRRHRLDFLVWQPSLLSFVGKREAGTKKLCFAQKNNSGYQEAPGIVLMPQVKHSNTLAHCNRVIYNLGT